MRKRRRLNQQRSASFKKPKARALVGKPSQSDVSVALQLREASERLSSNGFPSAAQLIDATKPEPTYAQFPPRSLANETATVYDNLVSQGAWKARQDADKERQALAQSEQESIDERRQRLINAYWSRSSKRADAQAIPEIDAARKLVEGLSSKLHSVKSRLAQAQERSLELMRLCSLRGTQRRSCALRLYIASSVGTLARRWSWL